MFFINLKIKIPNTYNLRPTLLMRDKTIFVFKNMADYGCRHEKYFSDFINQTIQSCHTNGLGRMTCFTCVSSVVTSQRIIFDCLKTKTLCRFIVEFISGQDRG